jgi:uncharacterized protein YqgC (DUF456 family)
VRVEIVAASIVLVFALIGVLLTAATLPGIWIMILAAAGCQAWMMLRTPSSQLFEWWTLGACVLIALVAEVVEIFASALGAKKAGGTRRGAIGSVIGALAGALLGTFVIPVPILGTIAGAALGAGTGAIIAERHGGRKTWREASTIGAGAAVGRLAATVAKVGFACIVAAILGVAAFV